MATEPLKIHVKVELMPFLRRKETSPSLNLELPKNTIVRQLLYELGFQDYEMKVLQITTNRNLVHLDEALNDGDTVWIGMVIGGG
jgi:sulfur carrier protein ThiS